VALRDPRLVGDDDHGNSQTVKQTDGASYSREDLELTNRERRVDDADVLVINEAIDNAVAIEKDSRTICSRSGPADPPRRMARDRALGGRWL